MDSEDALKKEEERLMRAISRQGSIKPGAIKAAPKVAPKPSETVPRQSSTVAVPRSSSSVRNSMSSEELNKLEREVVEQDRKREEERKTLERLDSAHFNKKHKDWFEIEFHDEDLDEQPKSATATPQTSQVSTSAPVQARSAPNNNTAPNTNAMPATTTAPNTNAMPATTASTVPRTVTNTVPVTRQAPTPAVSSAAPTTVQPRVSHVTPPHGQQWASDMDQLISSLATLGTGVTPRGKSPQEIALDTATTTLRSLKWNFAAPLPEPRHSELGQWIKSLGADLRQLRAILESAPLHSAFPYVTCAGVTQSLTTALLDSLALVTSAADRKEISSALLALVDRTLDWFDAMGRDSSDSTHLRDCTGEALTALVRQVTAVVKRQTEAVAAPVTNPVPASHVTNPNHVPGQTGRQLVVSIVQEAAGHAELISELLKAAPLDIDQFKAQLHLLVAAVKRIDPHLTREGDRQVVVEATKHVLHMAIELQAAPDQSPLPVLTAISELLRALTSALRSQ